MKIIDSHIHARINAKPSIETILGFSEHCQIDRLVILGDVLKFGFFPSPDQIKQINNHSIDLIKRYPEKLYGLCFLSPEHPSVFIEEEIKRCKKAGLIGIKLEASVNCRDHRLTPLMQTASDLSLPVLHHSWYKTDKINPAESDPADIAYLAARFPNVTIIMAHLTAVGIRGVFDIQKHKNVYVDTSGAQPFSGAIEFAVDYLGADRILYGSDAHYRDFTAQLGRIYGANITDEEREKILYSNAKKILFSNQTNFVQVNDQ
jgi:hypothetical protein